jgi:hypothetical protein
MTTSVDEASSRAGPSLACANTPGGRRIPNVTARRLSVLAVVLALATVPVLGGCGGDDEESAGEQWAGGVCSQMSTWVTSVEESVTSLAANPLSLDKEAVQAATEDVKKATDKLVDGLADLGPPDTEAGTQAKSELDDLGTQLQQQLDEVEQAADADSLSIVTVTAALSTAATAVRSSFESLESIDSDGELRDGFEDAESCDSLREQVDTIGE